MLKSPLVSVIMPVHNGLPFLTDAVESILAQTCGDFEFLIIDDHSSDASAEVLNAYAKVDGRVRIIRHEGDHGISGALNLGIAHAHGCYLARQDQDDCSLPERLNLQIKYLQRQPKLSIIGSFLQMIDQLGNPIRTHREPVGPATVLFHLLIGTPFGHPSVMIRAASLRRIGELYREIPAQDYDLWVRMITTGCRGDNIAEPLVRYRVHPKSYSNAHAVELANSADSISRSFVTYMTGAPPLEAHCTSAFRIFAHAALTGNRFDKTINDYDNVRNILSLLDLCRRNRTITWFEARRIRRKVFDFLRCRSIDLMQGGRS